MKDKLLGFITYPLRLALWIILEVLRISPLGKEKDAWVMGAFSFFIGGASIFIYKWGYAGLEFFLGRRLFVYPVWPVWLFTIIWFLPTVFVVLRLLATVEPEWFVNYWNCPPPPVGLDGPGSKGDPVFTFGDMKVKESAIFLGLICTGGIGSGKTATFVLPFLDQLLKRYNQKREGRPNCGGVLLDVKGEFIDSLISLMRANGRDPEEDIILINPDDHYSQRYNPIVPDMHHLQVAGRFRSILNNLSGAGGDPFWIDSAEKVLGQAILLMRINKDIASKKTKFVTLGDVDKVVADNDFCRLQLKEANNFGSYVQPANNTEEAKAEWRDLTTNIKTVISYFENQWLKMPEQTRMGVVAAVSNQLLRGFTDPKLQRIFCQDTDFSFYETCNDGKIVVLQAPGWGQTALMIGAALKLDFQQCMRNRLFRDVDRKRVVFFLADEYQEFITCGGQSEGDETFYAVSRQSRIVNAVATQSYNSLYSKVKGRESVRTLLQNLRVKVCLNGEDSETAKHVADLCGKVEKERWSSWSKDAGLLAKSNRGKNRTYSLDEKPLFEEWDFYKLQTKVVPGKVHKSYSEAIVFNGGAAPGDPVARKVRLGPIWLNSKEKEKDKEYWDKNRRNRKKMEGKLPPKNTVPLRNSVDKPSATTAANPMPASTSPIQKPGFPAKPPALNHGLDPEPLNSPFQNAPTSPDLPGEAHDDTPVIPRSQTPEAQAIPDIIPPSQAPADPFPEVKGLQARPNPAPRGDISPPQPRPDAEAALRNELNKVADDSDYENGDGLEPDDHRWSISDAPPADPEEDPYCDTATAEDAVTSDEDADEVYKRQREVERIRKAQIIAEVQEHIPDEVTQISFLDRQATTVEDEVKICTLLALETHKQDAPRPSLDAQRQKALDVLNNAIEPKTPLLLPRADSDEKDERPARR